MLDVVIVNWNSASQLSDAVASISENHAGLVNRVVVVDNASTDDSIGFLKASSPDLPYGFQLIENATNDGFGRACNQGALLCASEYLLFLNPDARLSADSLKGPLDYMEREENADVGICGIQLVDEAGRISRSCARFPSLTSFAVHALGLCRFGPLRPLGYRMEEWDHMTSRPVDHVIGAFYLIRRSLFESLKGFDPRFFLYLEDLDLSLRARQAGWRSVYLSTAQAFHAGGGSSRQIKAARLFYALRSRLQYGFKHFPSLQRWLLVAVTLLLEPLSRIVFSLLRGGIADARNTLRGYSLLCKALPAIWRGARP